MTTRATVQVTLEVEVPDRWGDDCMIGQVRKQAIDSAALALNKALRDSKEIRVLEVLGRKVSVFEEKKG